MSSHLRHCPKHQKPLPCVHCALAAKAAPMLVETSEPDPVPEIRITRCEPAAAKAKSVPRSMISPEVRLAIDLSLAAPPAKSAQVIQQEDVETSTGMKTLVADEDGIVDVDDAAEQGDAQRVVPFSIVGKPPLPRTGQGILLLDELSSVKRRNAQRKNWLPLRCQLARVSTYMSLPSGWHIVVTGNRASDKTHYRATSAPLRNRLVTINCEPDVVQWAEWAMDNSIAPTVVGFLRWRPELLIAKEIPGEGAFPSPRSWEATSNILSLQMSTAIEKEMILGAIGEAATIEFDAYLRAFRDLPNIEAILDAPTKAPVPKKPHELYALATSLAQYTREHRKSAMRYITRMPAEFALLYVMDVRRGGYDIRADKEIGKWIDEHKKLFETGMGA